jgi:hypothetical protein
MATRVTIQDETTLGVLGDEWTLEFLTEQVSVRELIRCRVYQEVTEHNARRAGTRRPLIEPTAAERLLNGPARPGRVDWEEQYARALRAFERNGFLLLLNNRQLTDLDEVVELRPATRITFLRLVPLAGG